MEETDVFRTLTGPAEAMYKVKGSKHYGYVFPVETTEQVKEHLDALRKKHHDARHHAYAYRLGTDGLTWRTSDDGEPANSAGPPILGALKSHELTQCLGVVVRYFGGTKLGVGGLIDAYRTATAMAIEAGTVVERFVEKHYLIHCPYDLIGAVLSLADKYDARVVQQAFTHECTVELAIRSTKADALFNAADEIYGCTIKPL